MDRKKCGDSLAVANRPKDLPVATKDLFLVSWRNRGGGGGGGLGGGGGVWGGGGGGGGGFHAKLGGKRRGSTRNPDKL